MNIKLDSEASIADFNLRQKIEALKSVGMIGGEEIELYLETEDNRKFKALVDPKLLPLVNLPEDKYNRILYGKNGLEGIVGAEADGDNLILFIQQGKETISKIIPNRLWVTASKNYDGVFSRLSGDRDFKFIKYYKDVGKWHEVRKMRYQMDLFCSYCPVEANFISRGFTYFKGLQVKDVPVLSFDIETAGLDKTDKSDVYLISNTYRNGDYEETKLFDFHDYETRKMMLEAWCAWVREKNPAIMLGHNIYHYDLPYLKHVADLNDASLDLGRDGSSLTINSWPSKFRKDGNEKILFYKSNIWGRELVDTYFLSFKYDVGRNYISNGLKQIIKQEGLEKQGRSFVDASKIRNYLEDRDMWPKICQYAKEDAADSLKLFDFMAPSFFYFNQTIPKKFEDVMTGATGSQLNSVLLRAYLQDGKAIPRATEPKKFKGAISNSVPGIYRNVWKVDVNSQYPSIIRQFKLFNVSKDPEGFYLYLTEEFTKQRLKHKELGKTNKYYYDLEQSEKIAINSLYGLCGAPGLNFNDPRIGEFITEQGRNIINAATVWATGKTNEEWGWSGLEEKVEEDE